MSITQKFYELFEKKIEETVVPFVESIFLKKKITTAHFHLFEVNVH